MPPSIPISDPLSSTAAFGLPDPAALEQLADAFFAALPAATAPTSGTPPDIASQAAASPAPGVIETPPAGVPRQPIAPHALAPHSTTGTGVPDLAAQSAPGAGQPGGSSLGVPEAYAAALPLVGTPALPAAPAGVPLLSTPYYFVGESSVAQSLAPRDDRLRALPFSLPGAQELQALLATIDTVPAAPDTHVAGSTSPGFYFLDPTAAPAVVTSAPMFDVHGVRRDFPILSERVNGRPLIWFDNAATTQKPQAVIDRLAYFYAHENSNIHRAAHELAARATDAYEAARAKVARFLGAGSADEIIFVRGATEAINLVAQSWGRKHIGAGDEIVISHLEHHANIVPWQQLASEKGAKLRVIPVDDSGQVLLEEYRKLVNDRTKLVAVTQVSNALGTIVPVREIVELAHRAGARALVDGAQSVSHMRVNVQSLDSDFFVFSGHKIFGPTGIGVVHGKRDVLEDSPPWQGGGNMIADVTFERTLYQAPPTRFEAGTGNIADAVGLGAALDYVERIGMENIARYEHDLLVYATQGLTTVPGLHLIGTARDKASVLSFVLDGYAPEEVGKALNQDGIAVRAGHHCAQPILRRFGLEATVRPSLAFYNTCEEVDTLVAELRRLAAHRPSTG